MITLLQDYFSSPFYPKSSARRAPCISSFVTPGWREGGVNAAKTQDTLTPMSNLIGCPIIQILSFSISLVENMYPSEGTVPAKRTRARRRAGSAALTQLNCVNGRASERAAAAAAIRTGDAAHLRSRYSLVLPPKIGLIQFQGGRCTQGQGFVEWLL